MATFTASLQNSNIKAVHAGVNSAHTTMTFTGTATASSIFLMVKVPNGATIVDYRFWGDDQVANQTYDVGVFYPEGSTSGSMTISQSCIAGDVSISGGVSRNVVALKLPYKVSISGEAQPKWAWVSLVNSAATSGSALLSLTVLYEMDEA